MKKIFLAAIEMTVILSLVFAFNKAVSWHKIDEIVKSPSNPEKIDSNNNGLIDANAVESGAIANIKYVVGYKGQGDQGILWKNTHDPINFNDVFAEQTWTNCNSCTCCEHPFDHNPVNYKGLRCKNENGWYLVGCTYTRSSATGDTHHEIQNNACIVGSDELSNGKLLIGCMKIQ